METMYLSGKEYAALQSLFAAVSHFTELIPYLEKRAKMIPGLYRDMRLVETKCKTIMEQIVQTVPPDKLRHVLKDIQNVKLYIRNEPPGSVPSISTESFSYTPTKVLNQLLGYVCEHECMMCDKTPVEARKCEFRKLIDGALPHDINQKDSEHCKYSDMVIGLEDAV